MKKQIPAMIAIAIVFFSCKNNTVETSKTGPTQDHPLATAKPVTPGNNVSASEVNDGRAIATIETADYILKIHKVIPFALKPKPYEPFKVDASTKLVALDVSVRNKLSTPINFSRILGMTVIKGKGDKNLVAPWVVAAYEVDYPESNHQKEYDALWSSQFEPNGFHRAILLGLNPGKEEKEFRLILPEKPDFNNPARKEASFTTE